MKFGVLILTAVAGLGLVLAFEPQDQSAGSRLIIPPVSTKRSVDVSIPEGATFAALMEEAGVPASVSAAIADAAESVYDLATIRAGNTIALTFRKTNDELIELVYPIDALHELVVKQQKEGEKVSWKAEKRVIDYEIRTKIAEGIIASSLYETAVAQGIDVRAVIALADVFQWQIDYAYDVQKGDTFRFVFEELYRDGTYVMPGHILAASFVNKGETYRAYYFEESDQKSGYFDEEGNSVERQFLKAPLAFKYISSGFTTRARYVGELKTWTSNHRAIDYAAAYGTPVRSVGDGSVTFAGWSSVGYGNLISIRHNGVYSTNYAHLSRIAVSRGQKVKQGQVIGFVGSTGFSTGSHLHYEMVKNGAKINPLKEMFPPSESVSEENRPRYAEYIKQYQDQLAKTPLNYSGGFVRYPKVTSSKMFARLFLPCLW